MVNEFVYPLLDPLRIRQHWWWSLYKRVEKASFCFWKTECGNEEKSVWRASWRCVVMLSWPFYPVRARQTVYNRHARQLTYFHMTCVCRILHVKWQDTISDTHIVSQTNIHSKYPQQLHIDEIITDQVYRTCQKHTWWSNTKAATLLRSDWRQMITCVGWNCR